MKNIAKVSLFVLSTCLITSCGNTTRDYKECSDEYVQTMNYSDGFVIAQLTDVHWSTGTDGVDSRNYMNKLISEIKNHYGKIDLIEFTGDQFMLSNASTVKDFLAWTETLDIPYATVWGNHDIEGTYNPNWLSEQFMKAEHSLYTEVDNDNVHGRSNYVINLLNDNNEVAWQIVNLDSGASLTDSAVKPTRSYDYIRQDQADWWKYEHDKVGANVPTIAYYHIAQKEVADAWEKKDSLNNKYYKLEGFANSSLKAASEKAPFFEIAKDNGLKATFMGHCHANDWTVDYEGVTLGFGVKSNIELYYGSVDAEGNDEGFDLIGASCVKLHDGGTFDLEHVYLNERSTTDFVKWVSYK